MATGLCFRIWEYGMMGIFVWFFGAVIPIVILWLLFRYRMLGAGDIKLFSMIGGMYGSSAVMNTLVLAFLAGGVLSIIRLFQTGGLKDRLQYLASFISSQCKEQKIIKYYQCERDGRGPVIHFSIAIFIGFLSWRFGSLFVGGFF